MARSRPDQGCFIRWDQAVSPSAEAGVLPGAAAGVEDRTGDSVGNVHQRFAVSEGGIADRQPLAYPKLPAITGNCQKLPYCAGYCRFLLHCRIICRMLPFDAG